MMMSTQGLTLSPVVSSKHTRLPAPATGAGFGFAPSLLCRWSWTWRRSCVVEACGFWCARILPCFVGLQERREVGLSRALERLQPWKRWPVAWIGMQMNAWEVGCGGLQDAQMQQ